MRVHPRATFGVFLAALLGAIVFRLVADPDGIGLPHDSIEWELRSTRVIAAVAVGAALASAGVLLQSLLRNPLAAPSLLGLTSGASLGVMLSIYIGFLSTGSVSQGSPSPASAGAGSLGALLVVYLLAQRGGAVDPLRLILVGVVISIICGAGAMLLQHMLPDSGLAVSARWMLGSLNDDTTVGAAIAIAGLTVACIGVSVLLGRAMDASSLGEEESLSVGVPTRSLRLVLLVAAGVLTAGSVLLAGPIGFVGLICPHAARLLGGSSHRILICNSALLGGALIAFADGAVRLVDVGSGRLPIGVLTTLIGGPVFLLMLRRRHLIT